MKKIIATFTVAAMAGGAMAQSEIVPLSGLSSNNGQGDGANVVLLVDLGMPNAEVTFIDWELFFVPIVPSWTNEPHLTFGDSAGSNAYDWDMGNWGGVSNSDPLGLAGGDGTSFLVGADGILRIELWEDFDDHAVEDGFYENSNLTVRFIPAPSSLALIGLGGLVATRRRR